jgi:hypothetical protein
MIARLFRWWRAQREWHRDHVTSWACFKDADNTGLSRFQQLLEPALAETVQRHGSELEGRELLPCDEQRMVHGFFADGHWEFWLYPDGAHAGCGCNHYVRYEEWDMRTPADFVRAFTAELAAELKAHHR